MRKLLAVRTQPVNYGSYYRVTYARSFEEAKEMILRAEAAGEPFEDLDLPVLDEGAFRAFLDWMEARGRKYPFSIYGERSTAEFLRIRDNCRARGFHFNS